MEGRAVLAAGHAFRDGRVIERSVRPAAIVVEDPDLPFVGFTSTQRNHWTPVPESTSIGSLQVPPPFDETTRKTSVFVTGLAESCTPFRL